ncbi:MAG: PhzF family phenazine biosynthesis protein [Bacteroidia bacterium]
MPTLKQYQVDAFTDKLFGGNPAAVVPLDHWLDDGLMQQIGAENNLSETAFLVKENNGYRIRWFTPTNEVKLCGHATLASAYVIFNHLGFEGSKIEFQSLSGLLSVTKDNDMLTLNFPVNGRIPTKLKEDVAKALGQSPIELYWCIDNLLAIFNSQKEIENLNPDFAALKTISKHGVITTAKGDEVDFVSRCFFPASGINEDPVTGSAHTIFTPYWAEKLGKKKLIAKQISKRGGDLICELAGDRVLISGKAKLFMIGEIYV